jgi:hypothetical protein
MREPEPQPGPESSREPLPWEVLGRVRRDCTPERGAWLLLLGGLAAALGWASVGLVAPGLVALPLGIVIWITSQSDLNEMRGGRRDPAGTARTAAARQWAILGVLATVIGWGLTACVFFGS